MEVSNVQQLQSQYYIKVSKALNLTMQELLNKLKEIIESDVYSYSQKWYTRTYDLKNNWTYSNPRVDNNMMVSKIAFTEGLSYNDDLWQHGSADFNSRLKPQAFLSIISGESPIGNICNFPQITRENFWVDFEKFVNSNLDNIFLKNCKIVGLDIVNDIISF